MCAEHIRPCNWPLGTVLIVIGVYRQLVQYTDVRKGQTGLSVDTLSSGYQRKNQIIYIRITPKIRVC